MKKRKTYQSILDHYADCLHAHGDSHLGVDWPNETDAATRYRVMLECLRYQPHATDCDLTVLDFGCGAAHLQDYIAKNGLVHVRYAGLDAVPEAIALSREKYPDTDFYLMDIVDTPDLLPDFDYIIMNGVFTEKRALSFDEMLAYFKTVLLLIFKKARKGVAFNVMSKAVDWERDDLFHLSTDMLISFLVKNLSRDFVIRNDYGLYEYTTYVYKDVDHGEGHYLWR